MCRYCHDDEIEVECEKKRKPLFSLKLNKSLLLLRDIYIYALIYCCCSYDKFISCSLTRFILIKKNSSKKFLFFFLKKFKKLKKKEVHVKESSSSS